MVRLLVAMVMIVSVRPVWAQQVRLISPAYQHCATLNERREKACRLKEGKPAGPEHRQAGENLAVTCESVQFTQLRESEGQELADGARFFPCVYPTTYPVR
jgi:hypothetical protein